MVSLNPFLCSALNCIRYTLCKRRKKLKKIIRKDQISQQEQNPTSYIFEHIHVCISIS